MSDDRDWMVERHGLRFVVQRIKWATWYGSAYEFAREGGRVARFWRRATAQAYADKLNNGAKP